MVQALLSSVAGVRAFQIGINTIGTDLANINTVGHKGSTVGYKDMLSQTIRGATRPTGNTGGRNPIQYGLGVLVSGTDVNNEQGALSATYRNTDVALQGAGNFMVSNGERIAYTRDGALELDAGGNLIHRATGEKVLGWTADRLGNLDNSVVIDKSSQIVIPRGSMTAAQATSQINLIGNLNKDELPASTREIKFVVYDELGDKRNVVLRFSNRQSPAAGVPPVGAASSWEWSALEDQAGMLVPIGDYTSNFGSQNERIYYDTKGALVNHTINGVVRVPATNSSAQFDIALKFNDIKQLADTSQVVASNPDGFPPGSLRSFTVGDDGVLTGQFSTGLTRPLAQISIAAFPNPGGLERQGNNLWLATDNSGVPNVGAPNSGGRGKLSSGFLEQSNVDIGTKFADLIITQRGVQANGKVVTVVDELLGDIIHMKR